MQSTHIYSAQVVQMQTPADAVSYSENFETSLSGWAGGNVTLSGTVGHSSSRSMKVTYNGTAASNDGNSSRTFGVLPGTKYTLRLWARSDVSAAAGVTVDTGTSAGGGTTSSLTAGVWKLITVRFTPAISSTTFTIRGPRLTSGTSVYIDDISLSYTPADTSVTTDLPIESGSIDLDEGWAPYAQGRIVIPVPSMAVQEKIDPRTNPRIVITCAVSYPDGSMPDFSRTFDLLIRERRINHLAGTIELKVESDDSLLQDYALLGSAARPASTTSAVTAVKEAMALVVPGVTPILLANLSNKTTVTRTNRFTNPSAETNLTGWTGASVTLARSTAWSAYSTASFSLTPSSTTVTDSFIQTSVTLTAGRTYTVSGTIHLDAAQTGNLSDRARSIAIIADDGTGDAVLGDGSGLAPNAAGTYRLSYTFTMPDTVVGTSDIRFYNGALTGGGVVFWDGLLWEETPEVRPYFDGSFVTSTEVTYAWTGTAHASTSTAVTRAHVAGEATVWQPRQTAFDYLSGLLDASGLRLFCDETRTWRITDNDYSVLGSVRIAQARNLTDGADTISRTNGTFYSGVQITYTYEDRNGVSQTRYDYAGTPGKVLTLNYDKAYPGPGAAAYILSRATGRGRTFDLTAVSDFTATPGQEIVASLPNTPTQTGYVSAVSYNLSSAEMTVTSRGLLDTPPTAWLFAPDDLTWEGVPSATTWATYTA